ncbi:MAG: hypothetical protein AAF439_15810, partial [Pseudomonadota bacterium]
EIFLPEDATLILSIAAQVELLLAQYPDWQEYTARMTPELASPALEHQVAVAAASLVQDISVSFPDNISSDALTALQNLDFAIQVEASVANPNPVAPEQARRGMIRAARDALRAYALDALREVRETSVKAVGKTVVYGSGAILLAVSAKLTGLAHRLPKEFSWLKPIVDYLAAIVGV